VTSAFWAEVAIELLATEAGGRRTPLSVSSDSAGEYRPHLRVLGGSGALLGVAFMDGPDEPISPGGRAYATIKALYEPGISYAELSLGSRFEILEGPQVVGRGTIHRLAE
jgi:hypothetical protein